MLAQTPLNGHHGRADNFELGGGELVMDLREFRFRVDPTPPAMAAFIVADQLASGSLLPVLEGFEPAPVALHAVYPPDKYRPAKTRAFVDFVSDRFRKRPPGGPV